METIFKLAASDSPVESSLADEFAAGSSPSYGFIKYEYLRSAEFMDECKIADIQQVEYLIEILVAMNVLVRSENEKSKFVVAERYELLKKNDSTPLVDVKPDNLVKHLF
jgi:hypothetical protein